MWGFPVLATKDNPGGTVPSTHSCRRRAQRAQGPSGASVLAGPCKRPGSKSSQHSCPPPDGSLGTQLWERYGKAEWGWWRQDADRGQERDGAGAMVDTGKGKGTGWWKGEESGRMRC